MNKIIWLLMVALIAVTPVFCSDYNTTIASKYQKECKDVKPNVPQIGTKIEIRENHPTESTSDIKVNRPNVD